MKRLSFWLFVIGSAALFAYVLDLALLASPKFQSEPRNFTHEAPGQPILSTPKAPNSSKENTRNYTNEEIYRNLQKQTVQMGIEDIIAPKDKNSQNDSLPPWLRKKDEGVYLEGNTPALLKNGSAGKSAGN